MTEMSPPDRPRSPDELEAELRAIGAERPLSVVTLRDAMYCDEDWSDELYAAAHGRGSGF